jgi:hypothetical protein
VQIGHDRKLLRSDDDFQCTESSPVIKILSTGLINLICSY